MGKTSLLDASMSYRMISVFCIICCPTDEVSRTAVALIIILSGSGT